jgi:iron complex outermembrane receptor protein
MNKQQPTQFFNFLFLVAFSLLTFGASAQQIKGTIHGQIVTVDHKPAENVSVVLKDTRYGTLSDEKGNYSFKVPAGTYILVISHVGAQSQELQVTAEAGKVIRVAQLTFNISATALQEVIVSDNKTNKFVKKQSDGIAKMPLNNLENPQSYTTVSKELIEEQQVFKVDDALKNSPGIYKLWDANGRAGIGGAYYTLRGFVTSAKLRNGVSGNIASTIDVGNLERLEVIKGPSATLFGNSLTSYGGLINRITKKPYDTVGGSVSYSGGSFGLNRITADVNAPVDKDKKTLLRINTTYNTQNSFQDAGYSKSFTFAPSISYKASDRLSFLVDGEYGSGEGNSFQGVYLYSGTTAATLGVNRADLLKLDYNTAYKSNDLVSKSGNGSIFAQMTYLLNSQWKSQTNIATTYTSSNGPAAYFYLLPSGNQLARMVWSPNGNDGTTELQENITGDFNIGSLRNRLTAGIDYLNTNTNLTYLRFVGAAQSGLPATGDLFDVVNLNAPSTNYYDFNKAKVDGLYANNASANFTSRSKTNTYSVYAIDVLNLTDNLLAMLSLRLDRFNNVGIYNPSTLATSAGYSQNALSPKLGLVYQIVKDKVALFGNYQNGFTNKTGTDFSGNYFKPEHANQAEGGIKLDIFDGRISSTLSYYNIRVDDVLRTDALHPTFSIQDGTQLSKGFEAEVTANPFTGFNIIAGYAHNDSKYEKVDRDGAPNLDGYRPVTAGPANTANLWASYRLSKGDLKGLGLGFGGNYASDNYILNNAVQGSFILPEYVTLNSSLFLDKPRYRLGLSVNNMTDKHYWVGYTTINAQPTRAYIGSVSIKF